MFAKANVIREPVVFWSAPAKRSGDGALDRIDTKLKSGESMPASKAASPLRSAAALQII
jgi:hypothetical protein